MESALHALPSDVLDARHSVLQTRDEDSLSVDTVHAIRKITIRRNSERVIVGSFRYSAHEYPGDIDLMETIQIKGVNAAKKDVAARLKRIATSLRRSKHMYMGDFKAGMDARYYIDVGAFVLPKDPTRRLYLTGYSSKAVRARVDELVDAGLLSDDEARVILGLVVAAPDYVQHKELLDAVKKRCVLRWSIDELIAGKKELPAGKTVTLQDALGQQTVVKMDVWALLGGRFIELTNWINLSAIDSKGVHHQLSEPMENQVENIVKDVEIYKNPALKKHMKLAKRLWRYAILLEKNELVAAVAPLFATPAAKLSQVQSDVETLINMIDKLPKPPTALMIKELQDMKMRVATVPNSTLSINKAQRVYALIDGLGVNTPSRDFLAALDKVYDILGAAVDAYTVAFLNKVL